jgi:hypothetical protein
VSTEANYLGTIPLSPVADRITILNSGTLRVTDSFNIAPTQGILLESGTATFNIDVPVGTQRLFVESVVSGSGAFRKIGGGNLRLLGENT